jgi:hypothetical protein
MLHYSIAKDHHAMRPALETRKASCMVSLNYDIRERGRLWSSGRTLGKALGKLREYSASTSG